MEKRRVRIQMEPIGKEMEMNAQWEMSGWEEQIKYTRAKTAATETRRVGRVSE